MKKRCVWNWNWYKKKKIEYLDEWGKWHGLLTALSFGGGIVLVVAIPICLLIMFLWRIENQVFFQNIVTLGIITAIGLAFELMFCIQIYEEMLSNGVYYLNEKGIQIEYYPHICREICWEDIDLIERRTISTGSREEAIYGECEIFFICKKGCTEKEKKAKTRGGFFYANHRKKIVYIGYSEEREAEFRQYWKVEIRDQRKWTRGMNLF